MIKVCYSEMDGPAGISCRLEAAGHAGYAPAGQDIVCAGASVLMQALAYLLAGEEAAQSDAYDEPDGPRLSVTANAPLQPWVEGAFELAKAGFALLAERYPNNLRFADVSKRGEKSMMDLQMFAEGDGAAAPSAPAAAPALSHAQAQQAVASGTMTPQEAKAAPEPAVPSKPPEQPAPASKPESEPPARPPVPPRGQNVPAAVRGLHARWAAEEAALRRADPNFSFRQELANPEMRRLMQLPGMRMQDAYRLTHYSEQMQRTAQAVEQGVVERIRQRAARPSENGTHPVGAAVMRADVEHMTRAQREALERQALHGKEIRF